MVEEIKIEKLLCSCCGRTTNHKKVWNHEIKKEDVGADMWESTEYELFQCMGCETPLLRRAYMFSEDLNLEEVNGVLQAIPEYTFWPKIGYRLLKLKQFGSVPANIQRIYRETIDAYNYEMPTLCAGGIRAVIESVCQDKKIEGRDLKDKINELKNQGLITTEFAEALHENRLLGNNALHELKLFGDYELKTAIELIEMMLDYLYESKNKKEILRNFNGRTNPQSFL